MASTTTIANLPEAVLVHILSFLQTHDAIRASLVSRSFRNLWHSIPSLIFDIKKFYSSGSDNSIQLFEEFVSRTISLRLHYALNKFAVTFEDGNFEEHEAHLQNWIQYAVNLSVSELELIFGYCYFWRFDFYLSDIGETCVKGLKLYSCNLKLPPKTNPIKFVSLKSLELFRTMELDGNDLCNLLARCVNLETLKLLRVGFKAAGGLRIYSATIKELYMEDCFSYNNSQAGFDICCPNLQKICLTRLPDFENYMIRDTTLVEEWIYVEDPYSPNDGFPNWKNIWEKILSHFSNISSLSVWDELLESYEVPEGCKQFASNVKHLEINCVYEENDLVALAALLKLLPNLEILCLHSRETFWEGLGTPNPRCASSIFVMPRIRKVILRTNDEEDTQSHFIKLFEKNGMASDKIKVLLE